LNSKLTPNSLTQEEAKRKPAIRTLTIRYALSLLKYLHEGGKTDLLKNRPICSSLFHFLKDDPPELIIDLLSSTEQHVFKDDTLPRSAKAGLFIEHNLERVTEIATRGAEDDPAASKAFEWLTAVCTKRSYGVLQQSGWYPAGTTNDRTKRQEDAIDFGLDSIEFYDSKKKPDVRNPILLSWILTLRPHTSLQERELVLTCFRAAPELVTAYFAEKHLQLEPKLSNTWIGYASFLFEIVRLPSPEHFGHPTGWAELPPQTFIVLDSILPRPLTQKVLTRCVNQSSELITIFAVRVLVLAIEKLAEVRNMLASGAGNTSGKAELWKEASQRLTTGLLSRCPSMKDIIAAFRKLTDDDEHLIQQEGLTRLLRLFYEHLPLQALEEQFDISTALTGALVQAHEDTDGNNPSKQLRQLRLKHLLQIARESPGMRWISKQGALQHSPIVTLLSLHSKDVGNAQIREIIYHVLSENYIIGSQGACDALVAVLHVEDLDKTLADFLDDCFVRASKKPVKYVDDLEALGKDRPMPSLLVSVLLEQAPHLLARKKNDGSKLIEMVANYITILGATDEQGKILDHVRNEISKLGFHTIDTQRLTEALADVQLGRTPVNDAAEEKTLPTTFELSFADPPAESESHPELLKLSSKDLSLALEDGDVAAVLQCLSSQYPEIRTQAAAQLHRFLLRMRESTHEDQLMIEMLLIEAIETSEQHSPEVLPFLVSSFASRALEVLLQPAYCLYPKVNRYLNKAPEWKPRAIVTYWIDKILHSKSEDDSYWEEVLWLLQWLVDGLRSEADLNILRKESVFETVMAHFASPRADKKIKEKVLELLWRATWVDGGSNTLITRFGVLTWLDIQKKKGSMEAALLKQRFLETCDQDKVEEWASLPLSDL
jgi:nucleolar pre-ribosomal-associated protein 1